MIPFPLYYDFLEVLTGPWIRRAARMQDIAKLFFFLYFNPLTITASIIIIASIIPR